MFVNPSFCIVENAEGLVEFFVLKAYTVGYRNDADEIRSSMDLFAQTFRFICFAEPPTRTIHSPCQESRSCNMVGILIAILGNLHSASKSSNSTPSRPLNSPLLGPLPQLTERVHRPQLQKCQTRWSSPQIETADLAMQHMIVHHEEVALLVVSF